MYSFDGGEFSEIDRITLGTVEQGMDAGEVMGGGGSASDEERDDLQPYRACCRTALQSARTTDDFCPISFPRRPS
jgi:hypothetical protein